MKKEIIKKIENKTLKVGVIGLGYVGLPLAVEKAQAGFQTIGIDVQEEKINMVNEGKNYIGDIVDDNLRQVVFEKMLRATNDFSFVSEMDFIAICVPTPLDKYQQPDISYVTNSTKQVAKYMKKGTIIVLESTTYPGTTEEVLKPIIENVSGLKCGADFYLGFSPERVDPGNKKYKTKNTPKVVGAIGEDALDIISRVYEEVLESEVTRVSTPAIAEMSKILENTYRNVNIGLVNELTMLCNKMKINFWEVVDAAKTKPYGFQAFYPGPGLGGHCIPLDPYYLSWKAREYGFHTSMIETSMMVNDNMPAYVVQRSMSILNKFKKPLNGAKILLLGVAYKQDIDDYRESPALKVIEELEKQNADIYYYDQYISKVKVKSKEYVSQPRLTSNKLNEFDLIIITTSHSNIDYSFVQENSAFIFDTKNATKSVENKKNIELL